MVGLCIHFQVLLEWAEKFVELGMTISFSGVVTFKKATDIQEAARELPLDKILVETDAPYLAPVPKRGREKQDSIHALCSRLYCGLAWHDDGRLSCCDKC